MAVTITPKLIKELRDRTGVGIGKCKEALEKADGDMAAAIDHLRKSGEAGAVRKEGRPAKEGLIAFAKNECCLAICEVNAETDFVVKNERFQNFAQNVVREIAATEPVDLDAFLSQKYSGEQDMTIDQYRASLVQALGENIQIRRLKIFRKRADKTIGVYSHLGGKILAVVEIVGSDDKRTLANDLAMHVAAAHPDYIAPEDVPENVIEHEKEIARTQIKGKPEHIIEKIITGRIAKFLDEVCLLRQSYIKDESLKIRQLIGNSLKVATFTRWAVGQ